jgi:ABC-2 type transport system permease protein
MTAGLRAEWTKFRTLAGNLWLLLGVVAATVAISAAAGAFTHVSGITHGGDATKLSVSGVYLGQLVVAALAAIAISDEYATGMIRVTLTATPRRITVLMAKAANLAGVTGVASMAAVAACLAIGRLMLPSEGLDPAHGYALVSVGSAATLRAAGGTVIYLVLVALLSLGVAALIRDTAVSIGALVALLYVPRLLAHIVGGALGRHIEAIAPMSAGLSIQATTHLHSLPIQPWAGLGVLAAWAAGSLLLATTILRVRDA